jgi:hypothetical protein
MKLNIRFGPLWLHNKEQFDLGYTPLVCVHYCTANSSTRIFYLGRMKGEQ